MEEDTWSERDILILFFVSYLIFTLFFFVNFMKWHLKTIL